MSLFVKRTESSGPPPGLLFGEVAYSDADQQLYVGRADEAEPPTTFDSNPTDHGPAIAALATDVADMETSQAGQDTAIAALAIDVEALETSQAAQDTAIAALALDVAALESAPPPVTEWNYDGPTEPLSPFVGFRWLETSGNFIIGRWEWSGSQWRGEEQRIGYNNLSIYGNTFAAGATQLNLSLPFPQAKILVVSYILSGFTGTSPGINASNFFTLRVRKRQANGAEVEFSPVIEQVLNSPSQIPMTFLINQLLTAADIGLGVRVTLSAGSQSSLNLSPTVVFCYIR